MPETAPHSPIFTTETKHYPHDVVLVRCHGRLVAGVEDILYNTVHQLIPTNKRIILDLSDLKHTDSLASAHWRACTSAPSRQVAV